MNRPPPICVITAKRTSVRLPGKNMLPLAGKPVSFWSVDSSRSLGLDTIVSTDIPELTQYAIDRGCATVRQQTDAGLTHAAVIEAAVEQSGRAGRPVILLQPTSPIRLGGIVEKCWREFERADGEETVLTSSVVHVCEQDGEAFVNRERSSTLWDGNVAIFPANRVCDFSRCRTVRNLPANSLQIDTEEDYVAACLTIETVQPIRRAVAAPAVGVVQSLLLQAGIPPGSPISVVGRPGEISEAAPVFYVNHCRGYLGGRVDGLFIIANPAIRSQGLNKELREVAARARIVVVRDCGYLDWLFSEMPEIRGKAVPLRACLSQVDDHLTSGAICCDLLSQCGFRPTLVGAYRPGEIENTLMAFHRPAMSREVALLWTAGAIG